MKKSILAVAGVAAFAGVAMPFGFANAEDIQSVTDTLTVTVGDSCTYGTATTPAAQGHTYTASGSAGQLLTLNSAGGATTVTVACNDPDGYTITPTFTGLTSDDTDQTIDYSGTAAAAGSHTWNALYSKNSGTATIFSASGASITSAASDTADSYTFSYKVGLGTNQAAGTYTGSAVYALAAAD